MTALKTIALKDLLAEAKKAAQEGRHADAQRIVDDAQSLPDKNGDLVEAQALIFQAQGEWSQASHSWKQLLYFRPDSKDTYINIAESLSKLERLDEAIQYYYEITRRWPDDIRGWIGRARIAARQENSLEALELWQKIMLSFATSPEGFVGYARVLLSFGCFDDAAKMLSPVVVEFPNNPSVMTEYLNALIGSRKFEEAQEILRQLKKDFPSSRLVLRGLASLAQNQQDNQQAVSHWKSLCSHFPDDVWFWNGYCRALVENNQIEEAISTCRSQIVSEGDVVPRITLLRFLQLSCQWEEAFLLAQEMREKYPENLKVRLAIIETMLNYVSESSIASGVQELQELSLLKPQNIRIQLLLAKGLVLARRDKEALVCIDRLPLMAKGEQFEGLRAWAAHVGGNTRGAKLIWARAARRSYFAALEAPINTWKRMDSRPIQVGSNEVLLFTMLRDQRQRLPWFLNYYRNLGVNRFFLVDNDSQDDSVGYLLEQPDVHLFWTADSFSAAQSGMRWINTLVEEYGGNNWCVYVDIDEALVFPNVEQLSLHHLVSYMERRGHEALGAFMIDMYPERLSDAIELGEGDDLLEVCPYYSNDISFRGNVNCPYFNVSGGKREALFGDRGTYVKTPIIHGGSGVKFIYSSHRVSPALISDVSAVLLHFKVMSDLKAFSEQQIVNGTRLPWVHQRYARYQKTLSKFPIEQSLIDSCSECYSSSQRFVELGWLKSPPAFWPELTPVEGGLRIAIKTAVPDEEAASHRWGDTKFAECLKRVLERNGHIVRIDLFPDMYGDHTIDDDVAIVLRGRRSYRPSD